MKNYSILSLLFLLIIYASCSSESSRETLNITEERILDHLLELSDDKYMGRMPFGPGDQMTVDYLVDQCKRMGLIPGNKGSYIQPVPMVEITSQVNKDLSIKSANGVTTYRNGPDYVINCPKILDVIEINEAELVFCGYGIHAPELNWNDFEGIDMKDKVAVVLVNDPGYGGDDKDFFKGDIMTYYGRWTYKYEEADRQGARGLLIIHETSSAGYPWFVIESSWTGPMLSLEKESVQNGADFKGWIHLDMAKSLVADAGHDLSSLIRQARQPGFKPVPLGSYLSTGIKNEYKRDQSSNVVALLPGSSSSDEYVLYSAHWDHLGIGKSVNGDSIYNGALDNASGTSIMLAVAEELAAAKKKPNRSIIFAWVTAEEQGLLGSEFFALNPPYPVNQIVANINIDGCNPLGPMKDFQIVGYGHSEMDDIAAEELSKQGRYVLPDQEPEKGYFFRSDHFNFAKVGIPPLFGSGGYDHAEQGIEYGKAKSAEYIANNYHSPSDEYDSDSWDMRGVVQDAIIYYHVGKRLANSSEWPKWKPQSEFKRPQHSENIK